ncbi:MAG: hypothetical protein GF308_06615 [Candidatus Heimdallarchaeota archaeon]|nr:hypothetical protein [Candidatus Heimdallarchaeota archaeon]
MAKYLISSLIMIVVLFTQINFGAVYSYQQINLSSCNDSSLSSTKNNKVKTKELSQSIATQIGLDVKPNVSLTNEVFAGNNLFVLRKASKIIPQENENYLLITDLNGEILHQRFIGRLHSLDYLNTEFINSSTILYGTASFLGSFTGFSLWNLDTNETRLIPVVGHHEVEYNPNSNTFFTLKFYNEIINNESHMYDKIIEFDHEGNILWTFDTQPLVPYDIEVFGDLYVGGNRTYKDVTHSNTVFYDGDEDMIYLNSRNANTFWKINHSNGEVIWGLGELGNFTLYNIKNELVDSLFYNAHSLEKIADNRFILFDNDRHNKTDMTSRNTRLLELEIDEQTMTAKVVWKWTAPRDYYSVIWGDADHLPNENRLGVFGTTNHPNTTIGARLVEVTPEGTIAWEMNFPNSERYKYGIYRMERVRFSPIIESNNAHNIQLLPNESTKLEWDLCYNFRNKRSISGRYELYLNRALIENDTIIFPKFWKPFTVEKTLSAQDLGIGAHTLKLQAYDEGGHFTFERYNISIATYFINREGPTTIVKGEENAKIVWSGKTASPLSYELKINNESISEENWLGEDIIFNLNDLATGTHIVNLQMYNNSKLVFQDEFLVQIFPAQKTNILLYFYSFGGVIILFTITGVIIYFVKRKNKRGE